MEKNNENRIYLVTGAAGFLGSNICAQLLDQGAKVRALVLPNDKSAKYIPEAVEVVLGNLCEEASPLRTRGCPPLAPLCGYPH